MISTRLPSPSPTSDRPWRLGAASTAVGVAPGPSPVAPRSFAPGRSSARLDTWHTSRTPPPRAAQPGDVRPSVTGYGVERFPSWLGRPERAAARHGSRVPCCVRGDKHRLPTRRDLGYQDAGAGTNVGARAAGSVR